MAGIYIHIPFCRKRCLYCGFFTGSPDINARSKYIDAVLNELKERSSELTSTVNTLYIGGGTPSLLTNEETEKLLGGIEMICSEKYLPEEITMEVNPEDVSPEKAKLWKECGVNRISLGVQTFDDDLLKIIGRRHSSDDACRALEILQKYFGNISIDLMFGLPGESESSFNLSLNKAIQFSPAHISVYSLMFEERSAINLMRKRGEIEEMPEEDYQKLYTDMTRHLTAAGYDHYEISNFAKPGYQSRHNSSYWHNVPYLGLGAGAHSYDGHNRRKYNINDLKGYVERYCNNASVKVSDEEYLTNYDLAVEHIMTGLRCKEGIDIGKYASRFGEKEGNRLQRRASHISKEYIRLTPDSIILTLPGMMISDEIIVELLPDKEDLADL